MFLDKFNLDNKVALITGGSRGIGLSIAHALGEAGAKLVLTSRSDSNGATEELKKANADFWIFITNKEESEKILESSFTKTLDLSQVNQNNTQLSLFFRDAVELKRDQYDQGIKIFLSLN